MGIPCTTIAVRLDFRRYARPRHGREEARCLKSPVLPVQKIGRSAGRGETAEGEAETPTPVWPVAVRSSGTGGPARFLLQAFQFFAAICFRALFGLLEGGPGSRTTEEKDSWRATCCGSSTRSIARRT